MTIATHTISYGDYLRFRQLILNRSGLHFPEKKRTDLENGIIKALKDAPDGITNVAHYYNYLSRPTSAEARIETNRLINILTIGETHFFRDNAQFDALQNDILPKLIAHKRSAAASVGMHPPTKPQLRIWCAGCATGEEPYSIAILLRELIPDIHNWHVLILGTDISEDSLTLARKATYTNWSFREKKAKQARQLYFEPIGKRYKLREDIRRQVTFTRHNLIEDAIPSTTFNIVAMDLIFCRNVTIYFTQETTKLLVKKFYNTLLDGGWLFVGHSEPSLTTYRDFQAVTYPKAILYQKTGKPTRLPIEWENLEQNTKQQISTATKTPHQHIFPSPPANGNNVELAKLIHPPIGRQKQAISHTNNKNAFIAKTSQDTVQNQYELAQSLLTKGKIDVAIQILKTLISEKADFVPAHILLARTYANLGNWQEARSWSQQAISYNKLDSVAYYILALVDENEGLSASAIENFKKTIYLNPQNPLAYFHLAILYKKEGKLSHAQRELKNLIKILQGWPPNQTIPESGDPASRLLKTAQMILGEI